MTRAQGERHLKSIAEKHGNGIYLTLTTGGIHNDKPGIGVAIRVVSDEYNGEIETDYLKAESEIDEILTDCPLLPVYAFDVAWCCLTLEWLSNDRFLKQRVWPGLTYIHIDLED